MGKKKQKAKNEEHQLLPGLPNEIWHLILGFCDETTRAICMGVCPEWRSWILMITRSVVPRIFKEDLACSISLLVWQRDVMGRPLTKKTCAFAALGGHLDILQYARANGCIWDASTCSAAARGDHLHILQYLFAKGFSWNASMCKEAIRCGHLHILQYAHENGCPWDAETCREAAENGHLHILEYLRANGCPE